MKKWLISIFVIGIFILQVVYANELPIENKTIYKCTDSDGGINYNIPGNVTVRNDFSYWEISTSFDKCITNNDLTSDKNFEENILFEVYCMNSDEEAKNELIYYEKPEEKVVQGVEYLCPNGCYDGRCLTEQEELKNPNIKYKPIKLDEDEYCNGCLEEDMCYPYGYLRDGKYCGTLNKEFSCFKFSGRQINGEDICTKSLKYWWYKIFVRKYLHI